MTAVLVGGIKLASWVNQIVVAIKLAVVAAVIVFGVSHIDFDNYSPFIPRPRLRRRRPAASWTSP